MNRIWIYQAERFLNSDEESQIKNALEQFNSNWNAHGKKLTSSYEIKHSLFIILSVDDSVEKPSGCSIDSSVHFLQEIEKHFDIALFNRTDVAYLNSDNTISLANPKQFQELLNSGLVNEETLVFNNMIQNVEDLDSKWLIAFKNSWHARVFDNATYNA